MRRLVGFLTVALGAAVWGQGLSLALMGSGVTASWRTESLGNGRALVEVTLNIPPGLYLDLHPEILDLRVFGLSASSTVGPLRWSQPIFRSGVASFREHAVLSRELSGLEGTTAVTAEVTWQACEEDGRCLLPESTTAELVIDPGPLLWGEILVWLLLAAMGGLLLNLMPCVLPLLSVKAVHYVRLAEQRIDARLHALAHAGGVALSLVGVSVVTIVLRYLGQFGGWGFHFQHPPFLAASATVLWALALALWGVYFVPALRGATSHSGILGSFLTGALAVFVAAPCTAPFLGASLAFALTLPSAAIPVFFQAAGLGFSLPYLILGFIPALRKLLPRPGRWVELLETVMGFLLAGFALYLTSTLLSILGPAESTSFLFYVFSLSAALTLAGKLGPAVAPWASRLIWAGVWVVAVGGFLALNPSLQPAPREVRESSLSEGWKPFQRSELERTVASGQPAFVDIWASWCTNCTLNQKTVLSDRSLLEWMDEQGVVRFKGDFTLQDPEIALWLRENGRAGLPVYAVYPPGRLQPEFLPELLSRDLVMQAIQRALQRPAY